MFNKILLDKWFLRMVLVIIIIFSVGVFTACAKEDVPEKPDTSFLVGSWQGAIVINKQELNITVHFSENNKGIKASIDIPQQNVKGLSLNNIQFNGNEISFELPSGVVAKFDGKLSGEKISGDFKQGQYNGDFYLEKISEEDLSARGDKADNKEVGETEAVELKRDQGILYGTLQLPENSSGPMSVALIIAGSGPTDRNGNSSIAGENNSLKFIAEGLAENGIASLRYDKRGIGESANFNQAEKDLRFDDFINDAVEWVGKLKSDKRFSDIYIIGHSQGSLVGIAAAQKEKVAGVISISGSGEAISDTLRKQISTLPGNFIEEANNIITSLENGKTVDKVDQNLMSLFRPSVQPFLISYMKYDPSVEISKLEIPLLIIQGTTDLQVKVDDAEKLKKADPDAKLVIIEGMNHVLKEAPEDLQKNIATYSNPDLPLADGLIKNIVEFIK